MPTKTKKRRRRLSNSSDEAAASEALARALENKSEANYDAIIEGFKAKGIAEEVIIPRENVFTYQAWLAKGRQVSRGEHGVKIVTRVPVEKKDKETGDKEKVLVRRTATVFHFSQTHAIGDPSPEPKEPAPTPAPRAPRSSGDEALAERFRDAADRLEKKIAHAGRPMTESYTARRNSFYRSRLHDAACMTETQKALNALADLHERGAVPPLLSGFRSVKSVAEAVRLDCDEISNGYHPYVTTKHGDYCDATPEALALQRLIASGFAAERIRQAKIADLETKVRGMQLPGFFPTPPSLAEQLVELADIQPGEEVLEPSAGVGSIAEAVREMHADATLLCVEQNVDLVEILRLKGFDVVAGDFLQVGGSVNRVIMNPPYEQRQDAAHVMHAYSLLSPGGRLVGLVSAGLFFGSDAKCVRFREWFDDVDGDRLDTLDNAFNGSDAFRKTGVTVAVILINA